MPRFFGFDYRQKTPHVLAQGKGDVLCFPSHQIGVRGVREGICQRCVAASGLPPSTGSTT
jgi:hypothetical protein